MYLHQSAPAALRPMSDAQRRRSTHAHWPTSALPRARIRFSDSARPWAFRGQVCASHSSPRCQHASRPRASARLIGCLADARHDLL